MQIVRKWEVVADIEQGWNFTQSIEQDSVKSASIKRGDIHFESDHSFLTAFDEALRIAILHELYTTGTSKGEVAHEIESPAPQVLNHILCTLNI